ncbi:MAG: DUF5320 domain-containing protein [Candidatus Micrarchaeia archaeon]
MPDGDGTGPNGNGPMTGCGRGRCASPRAWFGRWGSASGQLSPQDEVAQLELQLKHLDLEREYILKRLAELKK